MKLYSKTGTESDIKKEERSLIMGGYSRAEKNHEKELQPFEYISTRDGETESGNIHTISWLE